MDTERERVIEAELRADFARLELELAASNVGVADILHVYGEYERVVRQVDQYFNLLKSAPTFFAADNSTTPLR